MLRSVVFFLLLSIPMVSGAAIFDEGDPEKGKALFISNCSSCHKIDKDFQAPALAGVESRWKSTDAMLVKWINDPVAALATGDAYVKGIVDRYKPQYGMMTGQPVTEAEIKDILAYVRSGGSKDKVVTKECITLEDMNAAATEKNSGSTTAWWLVIGVILAIIAVSAANISRSLRNAISEREGKPLMSEDRTYWQATRAWMWKNVVLVSLISLFLFLYVSVVGYKALLNIGVYEQYTPSQPIAFSHAVHVCANEIDCQYCHSSASKSKHAGLPTAADCMNCHKAVQTGTETDSVEIQKIYDAIGFDKKKMAYNDSLAKGPIVWNKVHNLPDHVTFPHNVHVSIAGIDCKQCHGPVQMLTVGRQASIEEINAQTDVPGLIKLTKQTLTMGWCLECHNTATVNIEPGKTSNEYYLEMHDRMVNSDHGLEELRKILADEKATVRELGGWECGKCHY
ncbi:MAG: c-type cytochrome [Flavobacteriales bacterium]|nr:c-type cytochrome [Flavobacteriales bacterium]